MPKSRLLIVEDDIDIANMLEIYFGGLHYEVDIASRGSEALEKTRQRLPHLIVLDIMLPDIDGYEVCRTLRTYTRTSHIPVIFLTQKDERSDKIIGLDSGADDYITKPFSLGEFMARVRASLRRKPGSSSVEQLQSGDLSLDLIARKAYQGDMELSLSHKEFDLLAELMRNQGMVLSRDLLLTKVWGYDYVGESRTVDVHIRWLRGKLEEEPSKPKRITTVRSIGYRFEG